jgi:hypothetical protein
MRTKVAFAAAAMLSIGIANSASAACRYQGSKVPAGRPCQESISLLLRAIKTDASSQERDKDVYDLFGIVVDATLQGEPVGDNTVGELIPLLRDKDEWVRVYACSALGAIGTPARRAIPAMEAAVAEADEEAKSRHDEVGPDLPPEVVMRGALMRVKGGHAP